MRRTVLYLRAAFVYCICYYPGVYYPGVYYPGVYYPDVHVITLTRGGLMCRCSRVHAHVTVPAVANAPEGGLSWNCEGMKLSE